MGSGANWRYENSGQAHIEPWVIKKKEASGEGQVEDTKSWGEGR